MNATLGIWLFAVGALTAGAAGANPTVYIPLGSGNQVAIVDAAKDQVIGSYPGVANPHGLVATPDGELLVAGSLVEKEGNSELFLIHPEHGHVTATVAVQGWTHHQAVTPDSRYVISTHPTRGYISVLDLQSNQIVKTVPTGPSPNYALVSRDGKRVYVSNSGNGTVAEVSTEDWAVRRTLEAGPAPEHMVFSHDEQTLYVANARAGTVSAVTVAEGKISRTFQIGKGVHGLDISEDGTTLFVTSRKDEKLVALDPSTGKQRPLRLAPEPYHLNTVFGSGKVYVSSHERPTIWVVDQKTVKLLGTIELPAGQGHQMAIVD